MTDINVQKANENHFLVKIWLSKTNSVTFNKSLQRIWTQDVRFTRPMPYTTELWWYTRKSTDISNFTEYLNRHIVA